ncbi:ferredoxin [Arthrobacter sp. AZCC_0090]|uniref:ferredoxin n=1 Tax=Arthrobacter sp. AZCC_0090 TaxID=2735881 RepID=UPI0016217089|nr:ferredoxin [Arthrobacter sp. AZCC_0090]MBB6407191.1 ferredoxin [Arthrobacter sp. AZCC_0090]
MKIEVDRAKCVGLGLCEAASPEYFEVQDDGKLLVLRETVGGSPDVLEVEEAVLSCPTTALRLVP